MHVILSPHLKTVAILCELDITDTTLACSLV